MRKIVLIAAALLLPCMLRPGLASGSASGLSPVVMPSAPGNGADEERRENRAAEIWLPLMRRLDADGMGGPDLPVFFAALAPIVSQEPMGRKIRELYTSKFLRPPPDPNAPPSPRPLLYKNVISPENVARCRDFLRAHAAAFAAAETRYQVPKEIAVALLFVETRLGEALGKEGAFYTLASMASSSRPEDISEWLSRLPGYEERLDWMLDIMPRRADWAYGELRALIAFARAQGVNPLSVPGSIYGAVGICQFMPSNLIPYGADGNGDGVVDPFNVADAVASLSNYLARHGWKKGLDRAQRHAVLKKYNRLDIYANTILTLADAVRKAESFRAVPNENKKQTSRATTRRQ